MDRCARNVRAEGLRLRAAAFFASAVHSLLLRHDGHAECIVHSAGGVLLQQMKEHQLHCDLRPGDRLFYFTTLGWMMWNWLVAGLASEATLALYDGSPFHPNGNILFDYADEIGIDIFGTSAKYIDSLRRPGFARAIRTGFRACA